MISRSFRVDDDLWQAAKEKADSLNIEISEVMRFLVKAFVDGEVEVRKDISVTGNIQSNKRPGPRQ